MSADTLLSKALEALPIEQLINDLCPNSGARVGTSRCVATWRNGERESVEFYKAPDGITMYKDWSQGLSGNAYNWLVDSFGMQEDAAAKLLIRKSGIQIEPDTNMKRNKPTSKAKIAKVYDYLDAKGKLVAQTVRFEPKNFVQRRPHPKNSKQWVWGLTAGEYKQNKNKQWSKRYKSDTKIMLEQCETPLYNLAAVIKAKKSGQTIYVTEGEKDADSLTNLGLISTCNIGGGGNWTKSELATLEGCNVVLLADNDDLDKFGKRKGEEVAKKLTATLKPVTKTLSNPVFMPNKIKDVTDWITDGGTKAKLEKLVKSAPVLQEATQEAIQEPTDQKEVAAQLEPDKKKKEPSPEPKEPKATKETPAEILIRLLDQEDVELFNNGDNASFAKVIIDGSAQSFSIKDSGFKRWLTRLYWVKTQKALNENSLKEALTVLDAKAQFDGETLETHNRTARHGDSIYIDLANDQQEIVKVSPTGWTMIDSSNCPVTFVKSRGTGELPKPVKGGKLEDLRAFINVGEDEWALISAFIIGALKPEGPYPILNLIAEQGSGKSTTARIIKWIVDPSPKVGQLLRTSPRDDQALFIGAKNNHILAFDNISAIKPWLSDALCILSTGGSFVTRALYTDSEESSMEAMRPMILTGIGNLATRGDLLSRSLLVGLPRLENITTEQELWNGLELARASILGGIMDAMVTGLREQERGQKHKPETRLADFELWALACESGLGVEANGFITAYRNSKANAAEVVLSSSPVAGLLQELLKQCKGLWQGTATELIDALIDVDRKKQHDTQGVTISYTARASNHKSFPRTPQILSNVLDRLAPALRDVGIEIDKFKSNDRERKRLIKLEDTMLTQESSGLSA